MSAKTFMMFVYGTLKTQQPNHKILLDSSNGVAKFIANGITKNRYPLVVASKSNIPFLFLPLEEEGKNIHGEVYSVDEKMLAFLDDFEGHPNLYRRQEIPISLDNTTEMCSCYILQNPKPELRQLTFQDTYDNNDPQSLKYVPRYNRSTVAHFRTEVQSE